MNAIQSTFVPLELSEDQGVTWKQLVCLENYQVNVSPQTTKTTTFCGVAIGSGPIDFSASGSAICEAIPSGSQVTFNKILNWANIKEQIAFRAQYPGSGGSAGANFFIEGDCLVTKATLKFAAADVVKFDFELSGVGLVDINA